MNDLALNRFCLFLLKVLIGGSLGTGKSTFGMAVALDHGILKCVSTDTMRQVMRSFVAAELTPALHRSSYARSWQETCTVLHTNVEGLVDDAIKRGISIVVEGVHIVPSNEFTKKWEDAGGKKKKITSIHHHERHSGSC